LLPMASSKEMTGKRFRPAFTTLCPHTEGLSAQ
jgi:hypothetical protein